MMKKTGGAPGSRRTSAPGACHPRARLHHPPSAPSRRTPPLVPPREEEQRREREVEERTQGAGGDANGDGARPSQALEKRSPPAFSGVRLRRTDGLSKPR